MANQDRPYGLRASRHLTGGEVQTNEYAIATGYATSIFTGDPVMAVTGGTIEQATAGSADIIGVFNGCSYVDADGVQVFSDYWPAGIAATEIKALVYDDPNIIFRIQGNAAGHAAADVWGQADHVVVAGDVKVGQSKSVLSDTTGITGTFRILRLINDDENAFGAYNDLEVVFAEHVFSSSNAGLA